MNILLKIAWRNVLRHKGKSLVIGIILFLGAFLMTMGNGLIAGMDKGLKNNIINSFLGHLVIVSEKQKSDNVLFELYGKAVAPINNYPEIKKILQREPDIEQFLPVGKNMALSLSEESDPLGVFLWGVDFQAYRQMFPDSMAAEEGRLLNGKERGVLVPSFIRKEIYDFTNLWLIPEEGKIIESALTPEAREDLNNLKIKQDQVYWGSNDDNSTTDVRVGIKGIIKYKALNTFWGHFMILDIESYRESMGYFSAAQKTADVPPEKQALLQAQDENLESMFSEDLIVEDKKTRPLSDLIIERKTMDKAKVDLEAGTFNLILIKLKDGEGLSQQATRLQARLKEHNLGVRVMTWQQASGLIGSLTLVIRGFLTGFVAFLFLVAIIIIVNTLSMAALERISEIGMMRAVGAQKSFIRNMFVAEIAMLSGVFGLAGIFMGSIVVLLLPGFNITTTNDMLQLLYGGDVLHPVLDLADTLMTVLQLVLVTLVSVIYPVGVAQKITPLDAVVRD